jgi:hypothetical protein
MVLFFLGWAYSYFSPWPSPCTTLFSPRPELMRATGVLHMPPDSSALLLLHQVPNPCHVQLARPPCVEPMPRLCLHDPGNTLLPPFFSRNYNTRPVALIGHGPTHQIFFVLPCVHPDSNSSQILGWGGGEGVGGAAMT